MSSNSWVNQALAVVAGVVVGYFTAGTAGYAAYASIAGMATYAVTGTVLNYVGGVNRPKSAGNNSRPPIAFQRQAGNSVKDAAAEGLQLNSASESILIPVVFGRCVVSGNYLRYDANRFRTVPIIERVPRDSQTVAYELAKDAYKSSKSNVDHIIDAQWKKNNKSSAAGGKGGGSNAKSPPPSQTYSSGEKIAAYASILLADNDTGKHSLPKEFDEYVTGYKYFLTWEMGVCMGQVTEIHAVRANPGDILAVNRYLAPGIIGTEIILYGTGGDQSGTIRFYPGHPDQGRDPTDSYVTTFTNYRNVCFAVFEDYCIGKSPAPLSYTFEVGRFPSCVNAGGEEITGMKRRASSNTASLAYQDANPAAILWELFTNKLWGKGLDPNLLDEASFIAASVFFETAEIGMSFTLASDTLITEAVEQIRAHVNTIVVWSGGKLFCRCLMDRSTAYANMITLTSDNVVDPVVTRPTWPSCPNELRATFNNRWNQYRNEVAIEQDLAGIASQGRINSSQISLPCFSNRDTTTTALKRMLAEVSYPQAQLSFKMNRFETKMEPGDFMRFIWSEWSAGPMTSFWRCVEVSDRDMDAAGITVKAVEDLYMTAVEGIPESFTIPVPAYEGQTNNSDSDLDFGDDHSSDYDDLDLVLQVVEMPLTLTDSDRIICFFGQRGNQKTLNLNLSWRVTDSVPGDWFDLGVISPWAITGKLVADIDNDAAVTRTADWEIELDTPFERGRFLEYASTCPTSADPIDKVTGGETNVLRVGDELMQLAQAVPGSTSSRVRVKAVIRGQYGTEITAHAANTECALVYEFIPFVFTFRYDALPLDTPLDIQAVPTDRYGAEGTPLVITHTITNRARKALAVEVWDTTGSAGLSWVVAFRPRYHTRGQDSIGDFEAMVNALTGEIPTGYEHRVMPVTSGDVPLLDEPVLIDVTLIPDDGTDPATGMGTFAFTAPATTAKLLLYTTYEGVLGYPTTLTI